jgi:predicted DNA-binding protein (MmcQ/YjbR family)
MRPPHLLHRLSEICLALPEATRQDMGSHASFTVRKKTFAYYLHDHHGDGIVSVCFKVAPGEASMLIDTDEERFYSPAYIGPRGWVGQRLDVGDVDWNEVAAHVTRSYRLQAPKRLAELVEHPAR